MANTAAANADTLLRKPERPVADTRPAAASTPAHSPVPAAPVPAPAKAKLCLIVDDSRMIRKVSRQIVEGLGYKVMEAENGKEALARCNVAMPHLILLDWNMPVMTGIEFIKALSGVTGPSRPKVVFCTTNSDAFDIHKAIEAGANEFIIKPFDQVTLLSKLERIGAA